MADLEETARIRAYLEKHRATYDRAALRRKLLANGFTASAVDQAMTEVYGEAGLAPSGPVSGGKPVPYYLLVAGILFVNVLVLPALLKYAYEAWSPYSPPYSVILQLGVPLELVLAWALRRFAAPAWLWQAIFRAVLLYVVLLPVWIGVCIAVLQPVLFG